MCILKAIFGYLCLIFEKYHYMTVLHPKNDTPTLTDDPYQVIEHTLGNGMKLFMSVNPFEPRIFTQIAVRAGSRQDPPYMTGLAHYMEHMLFKGTSKIGALDWDREKVLLDRISHLYEQHRHAETEEARSAIYAEIDRVSNEAAPLAAANEYDKLSGAIGSSHTNAYTWLDQTVYVNEIPCNELERWMHLESERFRMMALRLFHTELETVYEEFNISQDKDFRKAGNALRAALFPTHPYGTQTTLGRPEHLKRPSHVEIQRYFQTYYVPGNMALLLSGDFNPEEVIALAEQYFGDYEPREVPPFVTAPLSPIQGPERREVFGQESPWVQMGWRFGSSSGTDQPMLLMLRRMLYNDQAGLLDIHLNQTQRVLQSEAWTWFQVDYSAMGFSARPREGQTLEEAEQLLLGELNRLRQGNFDEHLLDAVVKDYALDEWKSLESNSGRVSLMTFAYINGIPWSEMSSRRDALKKIRKEDIVAFARQHLRDDNYAVVYKRQGPDHGVLKVEKPPITPVQLNREAESDFARAFLQMPGKPIVPVFEDFESKIASHQLSNGLELDYVYNPSNPIFRLDYVYETGKNSNPSLAIAIKYLPYLGITRKSAVEIKQEFFRLGLSFEAACQDDRTFFTLSGLEESFEEGLQLLEELLAGVEGDSTALQNIISDTLLERSNAKKNRDIILRDALGSYARYGPLSPFTSRLPEDALRTLESDQLTRQIIGLNGLDHRIYYYGRKDRNEVARLLEKHHVSGLPAVAPVARRFKELETTTPQVFFVDFPIVQADVLLVSRGTPEFNPEELLFRDWYNEYFGYGLSSIVFQEIREAKALAYSTYAMYSTPVRKDRAHYLRAYVGTQPDKLRDAIPALLDIIQHMPVAEAQIEHARQSVLKRLASERILPSRLHGAARAWRDLGLGSNFRREIYDRIEGADASDLISFQQRYVCNRAFTFLVLGSRERVDMDYLSSFGTLRELTMEEIFGY